MHLGFEHTPIALTRERLVAHAIELQFPLADLILVDAELSRGLGIRIVLLGDELHRLDLELTGKCSTGLCHGWSP